VITQRKRLCWCMALSNAPRSLNHSHRRCEENRVRRWREQCVIKIGHRNRSKIRHAIFGGLSEESCISQNISTKRTINIEYRNEKITTRRNSRCRLLLTRQELQYWRRTMNGLSRLLGHAAPDTSYRNRVRVTSKVLPGAGVTALNLRDHSVNCLQKRRTNGRNLILGTINKLLSIAAATSRYRAARLPSRSWWFLLPFACETNIIHALLHFARKEVIKYLPFHDSGISIAQYVQPIACSEHKNECRVIRGALERNLCTFWTFKIDGISLYK